MERPIPEGVIVHCFADQHILNGLSQQHFAERAAGSDTAPDGVAR